MTIQRVYIVNQRPERPNHLLHLILTLITFGFWLPVWFLVSLSYRFKVMAGWFRRG